MKDFAHVQMGWETFYLLTGTAAATLIGLLFIAVSINIDSFHDEAWMDLQHFAALTFDCFFYVLLISILFLIPGLGPWGLGLPLLLLGGLGLANALVQQRRAGRVQASRGQAGVSSRFTIPSLRLPGPAAVGLGVILRFAQSLHGLVPVVIMLPASSSLNAFKLLVRADRRLAPQHSREESS